MSRLSEQPSAAPLQPSDRVRELLSFDLATVSPGRPAEICDARGQRSLPFEDNVSPWTASSLKPLAGFDEAGRGALAGPVVVGCVHFSWPRLLAASETWRDEILAAYAALDDSKRVTVKNRERLYERITSEAEWAIGCTPACTIDQIGIVASCHLAARRAYRRLGVVADILLFDRGLDLGEDDSNRISSSNGPRRIELTKGDARSFHIAAASIIAKVGRDAIMRVLDARQPAYGLARHKGYGTVAHRNAIRTLGPTALHRQTFLRATVR